MLSRQAETRILDWIQDQNQKSALLVSGARQVGKTWLIRECLQKAGSHYLEINLIAEPELIPVLQKTKSVDDLVINLTAAKNYSFEKGKTILFIDEVQEVKDFVTRIKFLVDDNSFRYILSGSLLGIELKGLRSAPVGYLSEIQMFPLGFEEFLLNSGVPESTIQYLSDCFAQRIPIEDLVHQKMMKHFIRYLVVGGMPAAVQEYVDSFDIAKVNEIQRNIFELYKMDFTKYENENRKLMLIAVYQQIASQLLKQNRRFNYQDMQKGLRFERLEDSFLWLSSAGVAIPVYNATEPRVSLSQNKKSSLLKLYASDVGLLTCQYGNAVRMNILMADRHVNLGGIYENAVAQELNSHLFPLYYYNSHKLGELDFIVEEGLSVIPLVVKSGKDYKIHSAITNVSQNPEYEIEEAYVLGNCNIKKEGKITYLPVYMTMFIRDHVTLPPCLYDNVYSRSCHSSCS